MTQRTTSTKRFSCDNSLALGASSKRHKTQDEATLSPRSIVPEKQVSFASLAYIINYEQTEEDLHQSWYNDDDYESFARDNRITVALIHTVHGDLRKLDQEVCLMGLEKNLTPKQIFTRKVNTARHVQSIVQNQWLCKCVMPSEMES
jgi:hypothetical protein